MKSNMAGGLRARVGEALNGPLMAEYAAERVRFLSLCASVSNPGDAGGFTADALYEHARRAAFTSEALGLLSRLLAPEPPARTRTRDTVMGEDRRLETYGQEMMIAAEAFDLAAMLLRAAALRSRQNGAHLVAASNAIAEAVRLASAAPR